MGKDTGPKQRGFLKSKGSSRLSRGASHAACRQQQRLTPFCHHFVNEEVTEERVLVTLEECWDCSRPHHCLAAAEMVVMLAESQTH